VERDFKWRKAQKGKLRKNVKKGGGPGWGGFWVGFLWGQIPKEGVRSVGGVGGGRVWLLKTRGGKNFVTRGVVVGGGGRTDKKKEFSRGGQGGGGCGMGNKKEKVKGGEVGFRGCSGKKGPTDPRVKRQSEGRKKGKLIKIFPLQEGKRDQAHKGDQGFTRGPFVFGRKKTKPGTGQENYTKKKKELVKKIAGRCKKKLRVGGRQQRSEKTKDWGKHLKKQHREEFGRKPYNVGHGATKRRLIIKGEPKTRLRQNLGIRAVKKRELLQKKKTQKKKRDPTVL